MMKNDKTCIFTNKIAHASGFLALNCTQMKLVLHGVGNLESTCESGVYSVRLPLGNGEEATMCGVCVDTITAPSQSTPLKRWKRIFMLRF